MDGSREQRIRCRGAERGCTSLRRSVANGARPRGENRAAGRRVLAVLGPVMVVLSAACDDETGPGDDRRPLDPELVAQGQEIFRFDAFGDEAYWTDTLRLHEAVQQSVSPELALQVGLKVDTDALPDAVIEGITTGAIDLTDPATTLVLLELDAVLGVMGTVETVEDRDTLTRIGITCALCHSTVDDAFAPGMGRRLDGWANRDLNVGAIVALAPGVPASLREVLQGWGPGRYDPRINIDGQNTPIVIPPAYGLRDVPLETFTGEGEVSYWNAYVAVTQMHGQGSFSDPRLGIAVENPNDVVTPKLPALLEYQLSLAPPVPPPGSFDAAAAERGRTLFEGAADCARCHIPDRAFTDVALNRLHDASETGVDPAYALRTTQQRYRTTPLRGAWQHPPYFHDGSAATFAEVVDHYDDVLNLGLTAEAKADLVEYLKSL